MKVFCLTGLFTVVQKGLSCPSWKVLIQESFHNHRNSRLVTWHTSLDWTLVPSNFVHLLKLSSFYGRKFTCWKTLFTFLATSECLDVKTKQRQNHNDHDKDGFNNESDAEEVDFSWRILEEFLGCKWEIFLSTFNSTRFSWENIWSWVDFLSTVHNSPL